VLARNAEGAEESPGNVASSPEAVAQRDGMASRAGSGRDRERRRANAAGWSADACVGKTSVCCS
jgi:hypothetical protein